MAQSLLAIDKSAVDSDSEVLLPAFTFEPFAGKKPIDELEADLVLVTKLHRADVNAALHASRENVAALLKSTVKKGFQGGRGTKKLLKAPLHDDADQHQRDLYLLLVGLGPANTFCGKTVCGVFEQLIETAIELGVRSVLVPFIPNAASKYSAGSLTHKATAYKLKSVIAQIARARGNLGNLQEVKILCAPPAVRHIKQGLLIEQGEACNCRHGKQ